MSLECSECERDLRGGHDPECSRHPCNKGATKYSVDAAEDEKRRPGFGKIVEELKAEFPNCTDGSIRAHAKLVWHQRNTESN